MEFYKHVDTEWLKKIVNNPNEYLDTTVKVCKEELEKRNTTIN